MKGSVDKSSGDWRSDNSVPYWTGTKFNGMRRAKSALQCMHGEVLRRIKIIKILIIATLITFTLTINT